MDFVSRTMLLSNIEKTSADDIDAISNVYESFLSEYPLCYGFWRKYANHKARLSAVDQVVEVYEQAVKVATYSVDLWADYCNFGEQFYEDLDDVRRLYERGLSFVGKDYLSSKLWDQWLAFEHSYKNWNHLVGVFIKSLMFPNKRLHFYYQSLKKLVTSLADEVRYRSTFTDLPEDSPEIDLGNLKALSDAKICRVIHDVLDRSTALYKSQNLKILLSVGEYFFQRSSDIDEKIRHFESKIRRHYFHVKPLDDCQLSNWHHYLDFVESKGDFDWTLKLYERSLIPCANYPEFWVRYVEYMEANGGREIATHAIGRAETTSLKKVPGFHEYIAKIKEHIGDPYSARSSLYDVDPEIVANFIDNINQQANLERRSGNISRAYFIYEKGINMLKDKQDLHGFCLLYTHFARFTYLVTGELSAAKDVFVKGISQAPHCKLLLEGLISFTSIHGGKGEIASLDSIVEQAIHPPSNASLLTPDERKDISKLFLEFVDLYGTIHEIRKAWARHMRLFPPNIHHDETDKSISINNAETHDLDKDPSLSKETPLLTEQGKENSKKPFENLSISSTNEKDAHVNVSSAMPSMLSMPSQPHQHQVHGYDQINASPYQYPYINAQMGGDQIPTHVHYQHNPWPMAWQAPPHHDNDHHHHQILSQHQYQSDMWYQYYYQQHQQNQSYYTHQQQGGISQQQSIQLNISELEQLKKKMEMDRMMQHQPQQPHQEAGNNTNINSRT